MPPHVRVVGVERRLPRLALPVLVVGCEECCGGVFVVEESGRLPRRGGADEGRERPCGHCVGGVPRQSLVHAAVDDQAQHQLLQAREQRDEVEAVLNPVEVQLEGLQEVGAVVRRALAGGGAAPLLPEQDVHGVRVEEAAEGRGRRQGLRRRQEEEVHDDGAHVVALVLGRVGGCGVVLIARRDASGAVGQVAGAEVRQHLRDLAAPRRRPELRLLDDLAQRQGSDQGPVTASQKHVASFLGAALAALSRRRGARGFAHSPDETEVSLEKRRRRQWESSARWSKRELAHSRSHTPR